jgi:hypothetical protein
MFMLERSAPHATANPKYSHITPGEMRSIMKNAVDHLYTYLLLKENDKPAYYALLSLGARYTTAWDEPVLTKPVRKIVRCAANPMCSG